MECALWTARATHYYTYFERDYFFFERILGRPAMYFWIIAARIRELGNELADDFLITADRALGILM